MTFLWADDKPRPRRFRLGPVVRLLMIVVLTVVATALGCLVGTLIQTWGGTD